MTNEAKRGDELDRALGAVRSGWNDARARSAKAAVQQRLVRARRQRRAAGAMLACVVAAGLAVVAARSPWSVRPAATNEPLRLADGTTAEPLGLGAHIDVLDLGPTERRVRLASGAARFDVHHDERRAFWIEAGVVRIRVLGTAFTVERLAEQQVRVAVERGRVQVTWPSGTAVLGAQQTEVFPPAAPAADPPAPPEPVAPVAPEPATAAPRPVAARPAASWRALAQRGRYDEAYRALATGGPSAVPDDAGALLLAADAARLSRHPADAVTYFGRMLARHGRDPRAPLAAFTLGLVELQELGRPREAARAFAQAQQLDPGGQLAQDALARETEAWFRAGDAARARDKAESYRRRYPDGRWLRSVSRFGGLEAP